MREILDFCGEGIEGLTVWALGRGRDREAASEREWLCRLSILVSHLRPPVAADRNRGYPPAWS